MLYFIYEVKMDLSYVVCYSNVKAADTHITEPFICIFYAYKKAGPNDI
jgi:hypothetical protein